LCFKLSHIPEDDILESGTAYPESDADDEHKRPSSEKSTPLSITPPKGQIDHKSKCLTQITLYRKILVSNYNYPQSYQPAVLSQRSLRSFKG